jgi:hypothetical protein
MEPARSHNVSQEEGSHYGAAYYDEETEYAYNNAIFVLRP